MKKYFLYIPIIMIVLAIPLTVIIYNREKNSNTQNVQEETNDPQGTIYVDGGIGTLSGGGYFSYIGESARGLEAYLAEKGATAIYEVTADQGKTYTMWVKLSDDAVHPDYSRDATIVVNNSTTLGYKHISEDTKGWKWYQVGNTVLNEGSNTIVFTKNETTSAAYVMDEFKLIPITE